MNLLQSISAKHNTLKNHIHTAWRIPLSRNGQRVMGFVYFTIPCFAGYGAWQWTEVKRDETAVALKLERRVGENGDGTGTGTCTGRKGNTDGKERHIGGRREIGIGGGVKLMTSTPMEQARNRTGLEKLLKSVDPKNKS